jgi:molybdopterin adenylyltransferase
VEAVKAAVLTISSSRAATGGAPDDSGPLLERWVEELDLELAASEVVPDTHDAIVERLRHWSDAGCALVVTSGGTGFAPDDVTPEATLAVCDREAPGIAEAIRAASREHTPHWMLSRGVAGICGSTLIVNFPGSPRAITQAADALTRALPHGLRLLAGEADQH